MRDTLRLARVDIGWLVYRRLMPGAPRQRTKMRTSDAAPVSGVARVKVS
jgi:hypothetical protein